jgi:hypothetical protein
MNLPLIFKITLIKFANISHNFYSNIMEEIKNKVANSNLITIDLADLKANQATIMEIDLADFLWQGLVLREKEFRNAIQDTKWEKYSDKNVYIHCSDEAILPTWSFMLIASKLHGIVKNYVVGSKLDLEKIIIQDNIKQLDLSDPKFDSKKYIIKGCSDLSFPEFAMTELMKKIQDTALSIMYGEPCSTVPIFKRK